MIGVRPTVPLLAAVLMVAAGCGGGEVSTAGEGAGAGAAAEGLLLGAAALPDGATVEPSPPVEPCGPLPILERGGAEAASSPLFGLDHGRVKEAVGIFASPRPAAAAYAELDAERRRECIRTALAAFSGGEGSLVPLPPRSLGLGAESSLARFRGSGSESPRVVDVVSIRSGRCVAALIVQGGDGTVTREVAAAAARSLSGPCG